MASTSEDTGRAVSVDDGGASFSGEQYLGTISFSGASFQQRIGVASKFTGCEGVDGVLGLGPTALSLGTLEVDEEVPSVADTLLPQEQLTETRSP